MTGPVEVSKDAAKDAASAPPRDPARRRWLGAALALAPGVAASASPAGAAPVAAPAPAAAPSPPAAAAPGALFPIGGALRNDNESIWRRFIAAAATTRARPRIAVFATAAGNPARQSKRVIDTLARYGADGFFVPAAPRLADRPAREAARDPALAAEVAQADGAFFTGGDQGRITATLVEDDGKPTPLLAALLSMHRRGGPVAGTSAGAAMMSRTMFFDPPELPLPVMLTGARAGKEIAPGLGLMPAGVFVDQHAIARGRFGRMIVAMHASGDWLGLGVDEDTALAVQGGVAEVVGASGVVMADLRDARATGTPGTPGALVLRDVRLSYLAAGDRVDLTSGAVTVAPARAGAVRLDHRAADFRPEFTQARFSWDMLGHRALTDLMFNLIENRQSEARGVALSPPGAAADPIRGYQFRLHKGPRTLGYLNSAGGFDDYTVLDLLLDIAPLTLPASAAAALQPGS